MSKKLQPPEEQFQLDFDEGTSRVLRSREALRMLREEFAEKVKTKEVQRREEIYNQNLREEIELGYIPGSAQDPSLQRVAQRLKIQENEKIMMATSILNKAGDRFASSRNKINFSSASESEIKKVFSHGASENQSPVEGEEGQVRGVVSKVLFVDPTSNLYIASVSPLNKPRSSSRMVIKGVCSDLKEGMEIEAKGVWGLRNGELQLQNSLISEMFPMTVEGIRRLMCNGFVKGIGPDITDNLLKKFGTDLFRVVEFEPEKLVGIQGLGAKRREAFIQAIHEKKATVKIFAFLSQAGLGPLTQMKIYKEWGDQTINRIQENPYAVTRIDGVGFATADTMALKLGTPKDSLSRIVASMEEVIRQNTDNGSTAMPKVELADGMLKLLNAKGSCGLNKSMIDDILEAQLQVTSYLRYRDLAIESSHGKKKESCVSFSSMARAEEYIAKRVYNMAKHEIHPRLKNVNVSGLHFAKLTPDQLEAARTTLTSPISVITGGPGCGKTTITKAIIQEMEDRGLSVLLVAPTGKAAKRMKEATGRDASTIHSALQYGGDGKFNRNEENPLTYDAIFMDEASMIDTHLASSFLRAVGPGTQLVIVGDVDQLPSIGAGSILRDIKDSGFVPVSRLTKPHRQAANSAIIANAHRIINAEMPQPCTPDQEQDFFMINCPSRERYEKDIEPQADKVLQIFERLLKKGMAASDIQVLSPMKKGELGVHNLNARLKNFLNPASDHPDHQTVEKKFNDGEKNVVMKISAGDRVMQTVNNKETGISNGEVGYVKSIDKPNKSMVIDFGESGVKTIPLGGLSSLELAYASTIHKSQGSEYQAVILPIANGHFKMLNRNLVYTALTRGKKMGVMVGDLHMLNHAVATDGGNHRLTGLPDELQACHEPKVKKKFDVRKKFEI